MGHPDLRSDLEACECALMEHVEFDEVHPEDLAIFTKIQKAMGFPIRPPLQQRQTPHAIISEGDLRGR